MHGIDFGNPEHGGEFPHGTNKYTLFRRSNIIYFERHGLRETFEVFSDEVLPVLNHVCCPEGRNAKAIYVSVLQADCKQIALCICP